MPPSTRPHRTARLNRLARLTLGLAATALLVDGAVTALTLRAFVISTPQSPGDLGGILEARAWASRALFVSFALSSTSFVGWLASAVSDARVERIERNGSIPSDLRRGPVWAIACWLVPLVNLIAPMRIVRALYRDATVAEASSTSHATSGPRTPWPVFVWWTLWLAGLALSFAAEAARAGGFTRLTQGLGLQLASAPVLAASAVTAMLVLRRIGSRREA